MLCEAVEPPTCMWLFILKYNFILNKNRGAHLVAFFQTQKRIFFTHSVRSLFALLDSRQVR